MNDKRNTYLLLNLILWNTWLFNAETGVCLIKDESGNLKPVCCADFEEKLSECKPCLVGYFSDIGEKCQPCPERTFGRTCIQKCVCNESQRCDNVRGCVNRETQELSTEVDETTILSKTDLTTRTAVYDSSDFTTKTTVNGASGLSAKDIVLYYILSVAMLMLLICVIFVLIKHKMGRKSRQNHTPDPEQKATNQSFEDNEQEGNVYEEINDSEINDVNELPENVH